LKTFAAVSLGECISLWLPGATVRYKVTLYRQRERGGFGAREIDGAASLAELLALLHKHDHLAQRPCNTFSSHVDAIERTAPALPRRAAEVCAGIALGMTSEAIGLRLGIKINTVRTHRKRAYAHLRISSQNEIVKLIFQGEA
jgi:DNA-binding CsgD family transcriptional regulator